jgi:hypothetical protein
VVISVELKYIIVSTNLKFLEQKTK